MIVCDWCHGSKHVERYKLVARVNNQVDNVSSKSTFDLCGPCSTALTGVINGLRVEREKLRPKSILNEEV